MFGLAKNERLTAAIAADLDAARQHSAQTGRPARRFKDFTWSTLDSWSGPRRVVAKAEWTGGAANPRFVVTSLARADHEAHHLYEAVYCPRGDMEKRMKECQLDLFADRTSAQTMRANQFRLWFKATAYAGLRFALDCLASYSVCRSHLRYNPPQAVQDRRPGAVSVRRIKVAMASACPCQNEFALAPLRLTIKAH